MKEPRKTAKADTPTMRALARELGRSPSHICRVLRGERVSSRLAAELRSRGLRIRSPKA